MLAQSDLKNGSRDWTACHPDWSFDGTRGFWVTERLRFCLRPNAQDMNKILYIIDEDNSLVFKFFISHNPTYVLLTPMKFMILFHGSNTHSQQFSERLVK